MKKLIILALPCVLMLSGCGGDGGGYSSYNTTSSGNGYANFSSSDSGYASGSKYDSSSSYNTSARDTAPFGNYPVNTTAKAVG